MLKHTALKKGIKIELEGIPYEILESHFMKKAQRRVVVQTKLKNLLNDRVTARQFHQGDVFKEAELVYRAAKFIYQHRDKFVFSYLDNLTQRFDLSQAQVGRNGKYLRANQQVRLVHFGEQIVGIDLPIKVELKVVETIPGLVGERSTPGTKPATLESGAVINVPLFIQNGQIIEINTETDKYVCRVK